MNDYQSSKESFLFEVIEELKKRYKGDDKSLSDALGIVGLNSDLVDNYNYDTKQIDAYKDSSLDNNIGTEDMFLGNMNLKENAQIFFENVCDYIISESKKEKYKKQFEYLEKINGLIKEHGKQEALAAELKVSHYDLSRLCSALRHGKVPDLGKKGKFVKLISAINKELAKNKIISEISEVDVINHLQSTLYKKGFGLQEKENLCGYYLCIKRSPYDINLDVDRKLILSILKIYNKGRLLEYETYDYQKPDDLFFSKGYVIRDSVSSLLMTSIGNHSIEFNISADHEKLKDSEKIYMNGSFFTKNNVSKPYTTWCHLSKICNLENDFSLSDIKKDIKENGYPIVECKNKEYFVCQIKIKEFLSGNFFSDIEKHICKNYEDFSDIFEEKIAIKLCLNLESIDKRKIEESQRYITKYI